MPIAPYLKCASSVPYQSFSKPRRRLVTPSANQLIVTGKVSVFLETPPAPRGMAARSADHRMARSNGAQDASKRDQSVRTVLRDERGKGKVPTSFARRLP
jgi:hypothetical protein